MGGMTFFFFFFEKKMGSMTLVSLESRAKSRFLLRGQSLNYYFSFNDDPN